MTKLFSGREVKPLDVDAKAAWDAAVKAIRKKERERPERERLQREGARRAALENLSKMTIEERLARIEEWIYDYRPQYVAPPRFR